MTPTIESAARAAIKARDAYGWSVEADAALERLRASLAQPASPTIQDLAAGAHYPQATGWSNPTPNAAANAGTAAASASVGVAQPASVPEGWKLVPVEPTDDMLANVDEEVGGHCHSCTKWNASWSDCRRVYAAMLAAAPQAPQPAQAKSRQQEIINSIKSALIRHEAATDAVVATAAGDDPHAATLAGIELEKAAALLATWTQPEYLRAMLAADPAAPQPAQATPAPEPEVWLYDFMDGATTVRNWSTTNKAEAYAPGNFNQRGYVPAEN